MGYEGQRRWIPWAVFAALILLLLASARGWFGGPEPAELEDDECIAEHALTRHTAPECAPGAGRNLEDASLLGADLEHADLRCARMKGANLQGASLAGADLYGADLRGVSLMGADLEGADLTHADLRCSELMGASLDGARMEGTAMAEASMLGASLDGVQVGRVDGSLDDEGSEQPDDAPAAEP